MKLRRAIWLAGIAWNLYRRSSRAETKMRQSTKAALRRAERSI